MTQNRRRGCAHSQATQFVLIERRSRPSFRIQLPSLLPSFTSFFLCLPFNWFPQQASNRIGPARDHSIALDDNEDDDDAVLSLNLGSILTHIHFSPGQPGEKSLSDQRTVCCATVWRSISPYPIRVSRRLAQMTTPAPATKFQPCAVLSDEN